MGDYTSLAYIPIGIMAAALMKFVADFSMERRSVTINYDGNEQKGDTVKLSNETIIATIKSAAKKNNLYRIAKNLPINFGDFKQELLVSLGRNNQIDNDAINDDLKLALSKCEGVAMLNGMITIGRNPRLDFAAGFAYKKALFAGSLRMENTKSKLISSNNIVDITSMKLRGLKSAVVLAFRPNERCRIVNAIFSYSPRGGILLYQLCKERIVIQDVWNS